MAKSRVHGFPFWQGSPLLVPGLGGSEGVARDKSEGFCAGWALGEHSSQRPQTATRVWCGSCRAPCPSPERQACGPGWFWGGNTNCYWRLWECVGKPQECQRRGSGGPGGVPRFGDSIFHICGAQSTGLEKPCAHLLAVQPKSYRPQRRRVCSFWKGGAPEESGLGRWQGSEGRSHQGPWLWCSLGSCPLTFLHHSLIPTCPFNEPLAGNGPTTDSG